MPMVQTWLLDMPRAELCVQRGPGKASRSSLIIDSFQFQCGCEVVCEAMCATGVRIFGPPYVMYLLKIYKT